MIKSIWEKADEHWNIDQLGTTFWPICPTGITVHYTADGELYSAKKAMASRGLGYHFIIDRNGWLCQTANLSKAVNHAGKAVWNSQSPNKTHLAVAIVSFGLLNENLIAWEGTKVPDGIFRAGRNWDPATKDQESRLMDLIGELIKKFGILPINICGHDECALPKGRKVDPGGSLSKTMAEIRKGFAS